MSLQAQGLLLDGLRQRRDEALAKIVEDHWESCCRFAYMLTGDRVIAEDIVQESFLKLVKHAPRLDGSRPLRPWLFKVIDNTRREYFRSEQRRKNRESLAAQRELVPASLTAEEREKRRLAREHVARLDEPFRMVLSLRFFDQLSIKDIARSLNCPENTVSTRIHRGLQALQKSLTPMMPLSVGALISLLPSIADADFAVPSAADLIEKALSLPELPDSPPSFLSRIRASWAISLSAMILALIIFLMLPDETQDSIQSHCRALITDDSAETENSADALASNAPAMKQGRTQLDADNGERATSVAGLRGRIVTEDGMPVSHLRFHASLGPTPLFSGRTDENGVFQWSATGESAGALRGAEGSVLHISTVNNLARWSVQLPPSSPSNAALDLGVIPVKRARFAILELNAKQSGQRVPGAEVHIRRIDQEGRLTRELVSSGRTNKEGRFRAFFARPWSEGRVAATIQGEGLALAYQALNFHGNDLTVEVPLKDAFASYGRVLDSHGKPLREVSIELHRSDVKGALAQFQTDAKGRFHLKLFERGQRYSLQFIPSEASPFLSLRDWEVTKPRYDARVILQRGQSARLEAILGPQGQAVAGPFRARILPTGKSRIHENQAWTELQRLPFDFHRLASGPYKIMIQPKERFALGLSESFSVGEGLVPKITVRLEESRTVKGRFIDRSGRALADRLVEGPHGVLFCRSDKNGVFVLKNCPRGVFQLVIDQDRGEAPTLLEVPPGAQFLELKDLILSRDAPLKEQLKGVLRDD